MTIFRITDSAIEKVEETTFAREKLLERKDLQRRLKANISVLSPDLMVIAEEFGDWKDSSRRIDLLCFDDRSASCSLHKTDESVEKLGPKQILFAVTIPCRATEYSREEPRR